MTVRPSQLSENDEGVLEAYIDGLLIVNQLIGDEPERAASVRKILEQEGISPERVRDLAKEHRRDAVRFVLEKMDVVSLAEEDARECERLMQDETIEAYMLERLAERAASQVQINGVLLGEALDAEEKPEKGGR